MGICLRAFTSAVFVSFILVSSVDAGASSKLRVISNTQSVNVGQCSGGLTVQEQNSSSNPVAVNSDVTVAASGSGFSFFNDSGCSNASTAFSILRGSSSVTFYFKGSVAGTGWIEVQSPGLNADSQSQTIKGLGVSVATKLKTISNTQNVNLGQCSAGVTVQEQDSSSNPISAPTNVAATVNGSGFLFFADSACTSASTNFFILRGNNSFTFYFKGTVAGVNWLKTQALGLAADSQSQTIQAVVGPAPTPTPTTTPTPTPTSTSSAARLRTISNTQTLSIGQCSAGMTIQEQTTAYSAVVAPSNINIIPSGTGFSFFTDSACSNASVTIPVLMGSSSTTFYFKGSVVGTDWITVSAAGLIADSQSQTLSLSPTPTPIPTPTSTASAGCSTVGTVTGLPYCAYASTSTWNQPLPANPAILANSQTMMSGLFQNYTYNGNFYVTPPGTPGPFPHYFTHAGDPTVKIDLTLPYGSSNLQGATVPMPIDVVPGPPSDAHLTVLDASTGNEYDYFVFPQNQTIVSGETINAGFGNIVNYKTGNGWGGTTTAAGATLLSGLVTVDEFMSGTIHHALAVAPACNNGAGYVYPATSVAAYYCPVFTGSGIPHGSRIWSDLTDAQVDALGLDVVSSMILKAFHAYGGFVTDTNGWIPMDVRNLMESPMTSQGSAWWSQNGGSNPKLNSQPASFFTTHFHVLQVCVTAGGC